MKAQWPWATLLKTLALLRHGVWIGVAERCQNRTLLLGWEGLLSGRLLLGTCTHCQS